MGETETILCVQRFFELYGFCLEFNRLKKFVLVLTKIRHFVVLPASFYTSALALFDKVSQAKIQILRQIFIKILFLSFHFSAFRTVSVFGHGQSYNLS